MWLISLSAGVGRTGTLITIDCVMDQIQKEGVVDIAGIIKKLRNQRMKMVQSPVCVCVFNWGVGVLVVCAHSNRLMKCYSSIMYIHTTYCGLQEQYIFIHDAVLEAVTCGDTQITARDLREAIQQLDQRDPLTHTTGFENQFKASVTLQITFVHNMPAYAQTLEIVYLSL